MAPLLSSIHKRLREFTGRVKTLKKKRDDQEKVAPSRLPKKPQEDAKKIEFVVSSATIAKVISLTVILLALTYFLYAIRQILVIFFIAFFFASALDPLVDYLQARKIPRALGVLLIYAAAFVVLGFMLSNLVPIITTELSQIANRAQEFIVNIVRGEIVLPEFMEGLRPRIQDLFEGIDVSQLPNYKDVLLDAANRLSNVAGNVFNAIVVIFNGFFNTALILVLTFLMVVDEDGINKFILSLFPSRYAAYIQEKNEIIKQKLGYWLRGQVVLMFAVGILVYIGFFIIGLATGEPVQYAATIALVAGLTELIPYAGPFVAWAIALPIVANQSLFLILWMTILMYIVQLLENNVLVPVVMQKAVGLSPIFVMFSMFVGFHFLGVVGMILAVPVATGVAIFVKDYAEKEK
ncbi:hypothetical protein COV82_06700 [Candidatus Peregrinibacteria bacterium CG11_big_fil_rev_8_21_14_0_20_46_8]|nr:MAG: hypothetical protein COV82_06700 [Candidatus Peregrinibacteria bacterium CG11_big_fil_rev_8_21_14_0_20_46_8]